MGDYIDPNKKYGEVEDFHAGRPDARERVVMPIVQQALTAFNAKGCLVEMGPADGRTSTVRFLEHFPGADITAIEFCPKYWRLLHDRFGSLPNVHPLNMSIIDYYPSERNSIDVVLALGAFTDVHPDPNKWIQILKGFKDNVLRPKGLVILEEEVRPYSSNDPIERKKRLAIQRGHVIFDALLRDKIGVQPIAELEIDALYSSLAFDQPRSFGDYKGRLVDFKHVFEKSGFDFHWVKVYPTLNDEVVKLTPELLEVDPVKYSLENYGEMSAGLDFYNFIFNQLLLVDTSLLRQEEDVHYRSAMIALKDLYEEMAKYKDQVNGKELLREHLGLELVSGQTLLLSDDLKNDVTGGVYVLVGQAI